MRKSVFMASGAVLALAGAALPATAMAQSDAGETTEAQGGSFGDDIVVTATRRETNIQDTPLAITAVGGETLQNRGISDPSQLTGIAPSLTVDQGYSNSQTHVSIRGLASSDFGLGSLSPVGIYLDDVYQVYQYGLGTSVYDLNRVEVLRGPQGTLFGKNTTGGALAYYSQTPKLGVSEGYFEAGVEAGDFTKFAAEGAFNLPLGENAALRFSGRSEHRDAYIDNLYNGDKLGEQDSLNGRIQLAWEPTSSTKLNLKAFIIDSNGDGPVYIGEYNSLACDFDYDEYIPVYNMCVDGVPALDSEGPRATAASIHPSETVDTWGATFRFDQYFGDWTLTGITGYQDASIELLSDDDGGVGDLFHSRQASDSEQFSQEVRLASPAESRIRGVFGLFYSWDQIIADQASGSTTLDPSWGFDYTGGSLTDLTTKTYAAFSSVTFEVNDTLELIGGVRYSKEKKTFDGEVILLNGFNFDTFETRDFTDADLSVPGALSRYEVDPAYGDLYEEISVAGSWEEVTWDATVNWQPTPDLLVYGKVATGFRSGGYPSFVTQPGTFTTLEPENVTSYELGWKSELAGGKLRVNGAAYIVDYTDQQVQTPNTSGPGLVITNAATSRIKGVELELDFRPIPDLRFYTSVGYVDAKFKDYSVLLEVPVAGGGGETTTIEENYSGNPLPYAPEWSGSFGASYGMLVGDNKRVELATDWNFRSAIYFDPYANKLGAYDDAFLNGRAQISYGTDGDGWRVTAYVQNLLDETIKGFQYDIGYVLPAQYAPMRQFGVRAHFDF